MTGDRPQPPDATQAEPDSRDSTDTADTSDTPDQRPLLRIVKGDATPEEVAALLAVVTALGARAARPAPRPTSEWSAHHRKLQRTLPHGPGAWRSSSLPS